MNFATRLKDLRVKHGYTQEMLSNKIGITTKQLRRYEQGESEATASKLITIARIFGVSVDYLLGNPSPSNNTLSSFNTSIVSSIDEDFGYTTYGIQVTDANGNVVEQIMNITSHQEWVEGFVKLCEANEVHVLHLRDILEDLYDDIPVLNFQLAHP